MTPADLYRLEAERRGIRRAPPAGEWLTVREAAEVVGIARPTLYHHIRTGALKVRQTRRDGRTKWEVERKELERWRRSYRRHARKPDAVHWKLRGRAC